MKMKIVEIIKDYPIVAGLVIMLLGLLLLLYQLDKKNTFDMNDYNLFSWKILVNTWGLIIMFIFGGLIIVINNL